MEIPNFRSMDLVNTVFLFSYFQIRYFPIQPQRISLTFNKMKVNKINEVWNSVNSLFKTFLVMFGLLSSKILLPKATRSNIFSLLTPKVLLIVEEKLSRCI